MLFHHLELYYDTFPAKYIIDVAVFFHSSSYMRYNMGNAINYWFESKKTIRA